jgi:predicted nucleotidyltransferase
MIEIGQIRQLTQRIVEAFDPERVILFGSYAYARPGPDSDVDLLVILRFEGTGLRKCVEILNAVDPPFAVDLLVRHPADAARRYSEGDPLIREALDKGRVLYERHS